MSHDQQESGHCRFRADSADAAFEIARPILLNLMGQQKAWVMLQGFVGHIGYTTTSIATSALMSSVQS